MMKAFQFDQCISDAQVIRNCNAGGQVLAMPIPHSWINLEDPDLIREFLPAGNPLVTTDAAMPGQHCVHVPNLHPGIIAIRYSIYLDRRINRTMTTTGAARILAKFKNLVPEWHQINVSNCVLFISEADVELSAIRDGRLVHVYFASYEQSAEWPNELKLEIAKLAAMSGSPPLLPPASDAAE